MRTDFITTLPASHTQQFPCNEQLAYLVGSCTNLTELSIAPHALNLKVGQIAPPTVNLQSRVCSTHRGTSRKEQGCGSFFAHSFALLRQPHTAMCHVPGCLQVRIHVGKLGLNQLEIGDRLAELHTLLCILERDGQCLLKTTNSAHRKEGPFEVKSAHDDLVALINLAQHTVIRHKGIFKDEFAGR